ncbi:RNA-binding protein 12B-like [Mixophyes fleayi]|uniref:RNA-binding protein 12B-like n=1 Tax=Mixophyes fleayi TaxID=3061075 RepID=UPI003F4DF002
MRDRWDDAKIVATCLRIVLVLCIERLPALEGSEDIWPLCSINGVVHATGGELGETFVIVAKEEEALCTLMYRESYQGLPCSDFFKYQQKQLLLVMASVQSQSQRKEVFMYVDLYPLQQRMSLDVKNFIGHPEMADTHITFLLDEQGLRTREAFVMLISMQQQQVCLQLHQRVFSQRSISVEEMQQLLEAHRKEMPVEMENSQDKTCIKKKTTTGNSCRRCMYLRNFPADITKLNIKQFFSGFNVDQEAIFLLHDNNGDGMGEALVKFSTEHAAVLAESLHRQRFLGTEILLLHISEEKNERV